MPAPYPLDPVALTEALCAIDSRNPSLVPDAPGEATCARFLADVLANWGFAVSLCEVAPGRFNVIARIGPTGVSPLVLNGHLDVVGVEGMTHAPFAPERRGDDLYARGSSDMKSGIAAMCVAAARAASRNALRSEMIIAAVCDEEYESLGTRALLASGLTATGAIITEPTRLAVVPAHKGFAWIEVVVEGRAAHGSRYDVGHDANRDSALIVAQLDAYERTTLTTRTHPLLGRASLHAAMLQGGSGWSTYADRSALRIERRTIPGERGEDALTEVQRAIATVRADRPDMRASATLVCAQPPLDTAHDAPLVRHVVSAAQHESLSGELDGLWCWTDAALFAAAGIPAICFGPGDIARAHSATEWVEVGQIEAATRVLERICSEWGRSV